MTVPRFWHETLRKWSSITDTAIFSASNVVVFRLLRELGIFALKPKINDILWKPETSCYGRQSPTVLRSFLGVVHKCSQCQTRRGAQNDDMMTFYIFAPVSLCIVPPPPLTEILDKLPPLRKGHFWIFVKKIEEKRYQPGKDKPHLKVRRIVRRVIWRREVQNRYKQEYWMLDSLLAFFSNITPILANRTCMDSMITGGGSAEFCFTK